MHRHSTSEKTGSDSFRYVGFALEPPSSRWYARLADRNHPNGDKNGNWEGVFPHGEGVHRDELNRGVNAGKSLHLVGAIVR